MTKVLECIQKHDEACGYGSAVDGVPCGYVCEICAKPIFNDQIMPIENGDWGIGIGAKGTENLPYLLQDAEDLQKFADAVNDDESFDGVYFKLTQDIDLSEVCGATAGENGTEVFWTTITIRGNQNHQ